MRTGQLALCQSLLNLLRLAFVNRACTRTGVRGGPPRPHPSRTDMGRPRIVTGGPAAKHIQFQWKYSLKFSCSCRNSLKITTGIGER